MREGWKKVELGDVTERINGLWKGKKGPYIDVQVYSMSNFTKDSELDNNSEPRSIKARKSQYEKRKLKYGDILIEKSGGGPNQPVGRAVLFDISNNQKNTFSNFTTRLRITEKLKIDLSPEYLHKYLKFLYLNGETEKFQKNSTNIRNLQLKEYLQVKIPIPPLPEQKRITAILDEAFEAIDKAKANVERNIENAEELFQSKLNRIFSSKNWAYVQMEELLELLTDYHANGSYKVLKKHVEISENEDYAWMVRSTDFENDFKNKYRYINEDAYNFLSKSKVFGGEIIMSKIGNAGKVYLMPEIDRPCSLAMNLFLLKTKQAKINNQFLYYYLHSTEGERQIHSRLKGTTTKTINKKNVKNIRVPLPNKFEQKTAITELNKLRDSQEELRKKFDDKLKIVHELKKAILQKAFTGKLTANETVAV